MGAVAKRSQTKFKCISNSLQFFFVLFSSQERSLACLKPDFLVAPVGQIQYYCDKLTPTITSHYTIHMS